MSTRVRWLAAFAAYVALSVAVGALMGKLADAPPLALRDRLFPSPVARTPVEAPGELRQSEAMRR